MTKIKINTKFSKIITTVLVGLIVLFGFNMSVWGVYNAGAGRYDDTLTNPHQEAVYSYRYENTAPDAAPGYFEMNIEAITGVNPQDQIQINSVTDSFPVNATTYADISGVTQTTTYNVSEVSFVQANVLKIKFSPQNPCTPVANAGCQMVNIPAAVPGRITIKSSLKTSAAIGNQILDASIAKIFFPNGFDMNQIGWRITTNYVKTDDVLDPALGAAAILHDQSGNGNPIVGQPYTVVVYNIKAVTGNALQAPAGNCSTVVSGNTYTGTGISSGVCVINIPINAGATVPGGTANISDGGSPVAITLNNIPYTSVTSSTYLTDADIPGLTVTCTSAPVNSTTGCSFALPSNKLLPPNFTFGINDATPAGTCTAAGSAVTCTGVPTGTQSGTQPIFGKIGTNAKVNTGETVLINGTALTSADIPGITFTCDTAQINATTNCGFVLPPNKTLPSGFTLGVGDTNPSGSCTATGFVVSCTGVPTGTLVGNQPISGQIGSNPKVNTGESAYILPSEDFYAADFVYTPSEGGTAPLFRSSDVTTVNIRNFSTIMDPNPANGAYTCSIDVRSFQSNDSSAAWTNIGTGLPYTSANGCTSQFTKTQRGNGLNWSTRVVITKVANPTTTYEIRDSYVFRFQGAGVASGG